jgi:hypothetical protein
VSGTVPLQMVCDDFLSLDDLSPWGLAERLRENLFVGGVLTRLLMVYMFTRSALAAMIRMTGPTADCSTGS